MNKCEIDFRCANIHAYTSNAWFRLTKEKPVGACVYLHVVDVQVLLDDGSGFLLEVFRAQSQFRWSRRGDGDRFSPHCAHAHTHTHQYSPNALNHRTIAIVSKGLGPSPRSVLEGMFLSQDEISHSCKPLCSLLHPQLLAMRSK